VPDLNQARDLYRSLDEDSLLIVIPQIGSKFSAI
jgi:hypothetical protein